MSPLKSELSERQVIFLALISAVVTSNAYYIHPIIAHVAQSFEVSASMVGAVPALNQIALAVGIFFLLPLGDRFSSRTITTWALLVQVFALVVMAFVDQFSIFIVASALLGFFTITPYLLPAYASRHVAPKRLGKVTATLTAGVIGGIVLSRSLSGYMGESFGWRSIYWVAATMMLMATLMLWFLLREEDSLPKDSKGNYRELIFSIVKLIPAHPRVVVSGIIQGLSFGVFLLIWMGLGLHLTSDSMGYGVDVVGYLGLVSAINVFTTPWFGAWADRIGPLKARFIMSLASLFGASLLFVTMNDLWLLVIPIVITSVAGPVIDVAGRMTALAESEDIRTRLMSIYIIIMFLGGAAGSWLGTIAYDLAAWQGTAWAAVSVSMVVVCLSLLTFIKARWS